MCEQPCRRSSGSTADTCPPVTTPTVIAEGPRVFRTGAHGRLRQTTVLGHRCPRPVSGVPRRLFQRSDHHRFDLIDTDGERPAPSRLVRQPVQPLGEKSPPPLADRVRRHPQLPGDRHDAWHVRSRTCSARSAPAGPAPGPMSPDTSTLQGRLLRSREQQRFQLRPTTRN